MNASTNPEKSSTSSSFFLKMLRFLVLAFFAVAVSPNLSIAFGLFPFGTLPNGRSLDFKELCKWFCDDHNYDYDYDYFLRALDHGIEPRIFCGLCEKKYSTTTTHSTTTGSTTTTHPTTSPASPTVSPTTTAAPTTAPTTTSSTAPTPSTTTTNTTTT